MTDILFNVNADNVRLHDFIPKHGKAEDSVRTAELQFRNARILPAAANAVLLGEGGANEVIQSFFVGDPLQQRFFGIGEVKCPVDFKARHKLKVDTLGPIRVTLVDKIVLRFEGGPQQLVWADFSVHIEDPDADEVLFYHEMLNRDVKVTLQQSADLVDEMRAHAQGMAVSTTIANGELNLEERDAADAARAKAVGDTLDQQNAAGSETKPRKKTARAKK